MLVKPKNVMISVKPEYALKIISGEKTIELRRKFPVDHIEGGIALIYASSPIKKIIGYAVIEQVKELTLNSLWKTCGKQACVKKSFFTSYFNGLESGYGISLKDPKKLRVPLGIERMRSEFLFSAPQSFRYISDKELNRITV